MRAFLIFNWQVASPPDNVPMLVGASSASRGREHGYQVAIY